jgi:hypothetical protein
MRRTQLLVILAVFVLTLVPFAFLAEQAEATTACCRLRADGTINTAGSFRCNQNVAETRRLSLGNYEVDFSPISADIRGIARSATLDTQAAGILTGEIGVADRAGDTSSVFVEIRDAGGALLDAGFDVCIHKKAPLPN